MDVNKSHIDKLKQRIGKDREALVRPVYVAITNPFKQVNVDPVWKYDILVSEMLGGRTVSS